MNPYATKFFYFLPNIKFLNRSLHIDQRGFEYMCYNLQKVLCHLGKMRIMNEIIELMGHMKVVMQKKIIIIIIILI